MPAGPLRFGVYPLHAAGTPQGLATGPPDDLGRARAALHDLGGPVPRTYLVDVEPGGPRAVLAFADRLRDAGLLGHAVLGCLRDRGFDLDRWTGLVREVVRRYGEGLAPCRSPTSRTSRSWTGRSRTCSTRSSAA
jgi:hypothetical protein